MEEILQRAKEMFPIGCKVVNDYMISAKCVQPFTVARELYIEETKIKTYSEEEGHSRTLYCQLKGWAKNVSTPVINEPLIFN